MWLQRRIKITAVNVRDGALWEALEMTARSPEKFMDACDVRRLAKMTLSLPQHDDRSKEHNLECF